jgi:hypothetical protein
VTVSFTLTFASRLRCAHDKILPVCITALLGHDLGQFPALRHYKIQLQTLFKGNIHILSSLRQLLCDTSGIETLEINIRWDNVGHGNVLFLSDAGWSSLDEALSGGNFASLRNVIIRLRIDGYGDDRNKLEHKNFILSYVNVLLSLTSRQCTLERC